jgi:tetrahydrodipicolinate N-succinyltransferase
MIMRSTTVPEAGVGTGATVGAGVLLGAGNAGVGVAVGRGATVGVGVGVLTGFGVELGVGVGTPGFSVGEADGEGEESRSAGMERQDEKPASQIAASTTLINGSPS